MTSSVLITGASGYLGQHLLNFLCNGSADSAAANQSEYKITAAYGELETFESDVRSKLPSNVALFRGLDLSSADSIASLVNSHGPFDTVVHLAAISSPGICEKNKEKARQVNIPKSLLNALPSTTRFVFLSTDQVYDGAGAPYVETDEAKPVNLYGQTKLDFEKILLEERKMLAVALRSSLILGPETPIGACRKQTFLQFVVDRLRNKQETQFFTDEYRNVVFVEDVCRQIQYFIDNGISSEEAGIFNMGGADRVSRLDIAEAVAEHYGYDMSCAKGVKRASLPPGPVSSPPDISMTSQKLEGLTNIQMIGLKDMIAMGLHVPTKK